MNFHTIAASLMVTALCSLPFQAHATKFVPYKDCEIKRAYEEKPFSEFKIKAVSESTKLSEREKKQLAITIEEIGENAVGTAEFQELRYGDFSVTEVRYYPTMYASGVIFKAGTTQILATMDDGNVICR